MVRERDATLSQCCSLSLAHLRKAFVLSDKPKPFRSAGATSLSFALAATAAAASAAEAAAAAAQLSASFQFAVTSQSLRSSLSFAFAVVCIVLRSVQLRLVATGKASCRSRYALSSCASGDRSTTFSARVPLAICLWVASVELCNNLLRQVTTLICNTCRSYRGTQWTSLQVCGNPCKTVQSCANPCKSVQVKIREHTRQAWLGCSLDWICFMFLLRLAICLQLGPPFWFAALRFGTFFRVSSSPLSLCFLLAGHSFLHKLFCPPSGAIKSHLNLLKYWPVSGSASTTKMWQDYACNFDEIKESYVRQFWSRT